MKNFWTNYPEIAYELEIVKNIIKDNIKSSEKYFKESIFELVDAGGKMLRPGLLLIASRFGNYDKEKMYNLAAAIELMHSATLIHDDIIDEARFRRGIETIQSKLGKEYAVYTGDFLFCQCFIMLSKFNYSMDNLREISAAISQICKGEIRQYNLRYSLDTGIKNYLKIISGKTAALFAISLYTGAWESQCDEKTSKLLGRIGYHVGMAFQIIDDILDFTGDTLRLGKKTHTDIIKGYYTLPIIYAIKEDKEGKIKDILENNIIEEKEIQELIKLVNQFKGIEKSRKLADKYTEKAFRSIEELPECKAKKILKEITHELLSRNY
ncbi:geranylgeranyl pyrophosphate synthase [Fervidicella metallireducens AeB]|uniref:Geranylgeranyl pyrophosphate synthase n=1 Tax=Fervidicella metallireducens AeB TaxID=1403537 RepID=A0A017RX58_9CLOT|nr:polyprenyl synthetase family protein [Fervidicella metallireducens]EYE89363.1 geranylgeranyl pyrophosphate synthase [Fervidicella metallireducens AeB]